MTPGKLLYLSQDDVAAIDLPMSEIVAALEDMFREKGEGRTEMLPAAWTRLTKRPKNSNMDCGRSSVMRPAL